MTRTIAALNKMERSRMAGKIREGFFFTMDDGSSKGLGVDDDGNLYWDKKPVVTKTKLSFGWLVNSAAVLAAIATAVQAVVAVLTFIKHP